MYGNKAFLRIGLLEATNVAALYKSSYELLDYKWSLKRGIDEKGKVQTSLRGGMLELTFPSFPTDEILKWAVDVKHNTKDGVLVLCGENEIPVNKVIFEKGECISMDVNYALYGSAYAATKIIISAEVITVADVIFIEKNWVNL